MFAQGAENTRRPHPGNRKAPAADRCFEPALRLFHPACGAIAIPICPRRSGPACGVVRRARDCQETDEDPGAAFHGSDPGSGASSQDHSGPIILLQLIQFIHRLAGSPVGDRMEPECCRVPLAAASSSYCRYRSFRRGDLGRHHLRRHTYRPHVHRLPLGRHGLADQPGLFVPAAHFELSVLAGDPDRCDYFHWDPGPATDCEAVRRGPLLHPEPCSPVAAAQGLLRLVQLLVQLPLQAVGDFRPSSWGWNWD